MDLAIELCDEEDADDIENLREIRELFKPIGFMTELAMLRTPNKPLEPNSKVVSIYLLLMLLTFAMNTLLSLQN